VSCSLVLTTLPIWNFTPHRTIRYEFGARLLRAPKICGMGGRECDSRPLNVCLALGVTLCALVLALTLKAAYNSGGSGQRWLCPCRQQTVRFKLHYRWKSTDGTIKNVDAPSTTWTLPAGPGIHFAYVLVSNNHGGYTERRILVNTDTIGSELPEQESYSRLVAPPSPDRWEILPQLGDRGRDATRIANPHEVYVPNLLAYAQDPVSGNVFPPSGYVKSNVRVRSSFREFRHRRWRALTTI